MKIFSLVGWSGSGKTRVVSALIIHFKQKNKSIAALKNIPHHYSVEPEGKDSWKFLQSGADMVFLTSRDEILSLKKRQPSDYLISELIPNLKNFDIVLLEGLTGENIPIIEVFNSKRNKKLKFPLKKLTAIISDLKIKARIPCFYIKNIKRIATFMEEYDGQ